MFEAELERVRKQLKQQIASAQPYVSIVELLSHAQVHPAVSAFFRAEVDWWVHEEQALRTSNPRFATTDPAFADVFRRLDALYVQHARFDHEELTTTIDAAAKTWLNYLCRPRVTLRWFVFRGEPTKPLHEILLRLQYLTEYGYLLDGFRQWAATRSSEASGFEILSVIEFERIIEKIDNDAILDMSQSQFVALLDPLFAFFAAYDPDLPPESVPTEAVIIFLDDKGAVPISQALERMLYREEMRTLTRTKLIEVIDGVLASLDVDEQHGLVSPESAQSGVERTISAHDDADRSEQSVAQLITDSAAKSVEEVSLVSALPETIVRDVVVAEPNTLAAEGIAEEQTPEDVVADRHDSDTDVEQPFNVNGADTIIIEDADTVIIEAAQNVIIEAADHVVEASSDVGAANAEGLDSEDVRPSAPETASSVTSADQDNGVTQSIADDSADDARMLRKHERSERLATLIDDKLRDRVVKRVFDRSQKHYDEVIELVLDCDTWKSAAGALDRYYAQHGIEPNSAAAIEFSQAVYRSFTGINP